MTATKPRILAASGWRGSAKTGYDLTMAAVTRETLAMVDRLMLEMIAQQESKVLQMARTIHPGVTNEDIRNPQDFPDLIENAGWNFEDGILAGLKSGHIALRARIIEETSK